MRAPHRLLEDVTKATITAMADDLVIKALDIKGNRDVLASGIIRRLPIAEGIHISLGYLRGQSAYVAQARGTPGLTIEAFKPAAAPSSMTASASALVRP